MPKGFVTKEQTGWVGTRTSQFVNWVVDTAYTLFLTLHGKEFQPTKKPMSCWYQRWNRQRELGWESEKKQKENPDGKVKLGDMVKCP